MITTSTVSTTTTVGALFYTLSIPPQTMPTVSHSHTNPVIITTTVSSTQGNV